MKMKDVVLDTAGFLTVRGDAVELHFAKTSGQLVRIADAVTGKTVMAAPDGAFQSVELHEGGHIVPLPPHQPHFYTDQPCDVRIRGAETRFESYETTLLPDGVRVGVTFGDGSWDVTQFVTLRAHSPAVRIDWKIVRRGEGPVKFRKLVFRLPELCENGLLAALPGASAVPDSPADKMPALTYFKYGAFLRSKEDDLTIGTWGCDPYFMLLGKYANNAGKTEILYEHYAADTFEKGDSLFFGSDYIMIHHGPRAGAIEKFREHYADHALSLDRGVAPAAKNSIIWEGCVGEILFDPDFSYGTYPALSDFKADLPRIASLGFNTIQLMPQMPFPWYTVYHYDDLHGTYGGESEEEVRDFIRTAKSLGLRVVLDIVVHGVADAESSSKGLERYTCRRRLFKAGLEKAEKINRYRREHPEWFRRDENGDFHFLHTWDLDFDSPSLCRMFIDHLKRCVDEFGCDGFRIDAPYWGCEPNWDPDYPLRAGASFSRNVAMLRAAERELRETHPDLIWYTEHEHAEWRSFMDMTYTYEEGWLLYRPESGRLPPVFEGKISAAEMALWFDLRRRVLPRRDIVLQHHIDSHDSWWNEAQSAFGYEKFGPGPARLLTAFCMLTDGAFLAFTGAEKGNEDFFRKILSLRNGIPALAQGSCDYLKCDTGHPSVLALYREYDGAFCIPVFNFSEQISRCRLRVRGPLPVCEGTLRNAADAPEVCADFTSRLLEDEGIELELPANGLLILHL